jgi:hypothetical protein
MRSMRLLLCLLSLVFCGWAQEGPAQVNLPPATIAGELPGERISDPGKQGDWPAIAYGKDGSLWAIWIEWNDKDADRVLVRRRDPQGNWGLPIPMEDGNWDHYSPAIVATPNGAMALWSGQSDGNYDLFAATVSTAGAPSKPQRLTTAPFADFNARAASDSAGNVTVVWQSFRAGNGDIYARRFAKSAWGPETKISDSTGDDWEPAVALDKEGRAWISWDGYGTGNYDVYLRSFDGRKLSPVVAITSEPTAQFHTSVAVDGENRVWIAWDEADQNWGKDFSAVSAAPGSRGLHYSRRLGLRVYANGRVQNPSADPNAVLTGRMQRYAELPHLAFDGSGALWMVFRHWTLAQPHEIYHFYAMNLTGDKWSLPLKLTASSGHNSQHASLSLSPEGLLSAGYSSDGRAPGDRLSDPVHAPHYNVYVSNLPKGDAPPKVTLLDAPLPPALTPSAPRERIALTAGGKTYRLLMGDAHRHTDIRGHSGVDGSILDTYRYAMDAAKLDWLGVSDHNEVVGGRWPDGVRDYQWWYTQKAVDLMSHPPVFIGVYSYEHSLNRPSGHRNVLFLKRGGPLRVADRERVPEDNLPPNLWKWMQEHALTQPGQRVVIVPHTFGERTQPLADWNWENPRFDCLMEIYQGARSSYEAYQAPQAERRGGSQIDEKGHFAQDALGKGFIYGFVSFSDHGSTHNSWAAVWSPTEDRAGLFDGLYGRRTYAASDEMLIKATAAGHMPGEEFTASATQPPLIEASIAAPDELVRIDVVKDGKYIYTTHPQGRSAKLSFRDTDAKPGKNYYYLRFFQRDTEKPDGYPEIAWTSPWYVTYR